MAGTLVGRTGLDVVLSDGELLGDRLSDLELYSNLISTGFDAKILSIVNVDVGVEPLLQSRNFISSFRIISFSLSLFKCIRFGSDECCGICVFCCDIG